MRLTVLLLPAVILAQLSGQPLSPRESNRHTTDVPKRHVEVISKFDIRNSKQAGYAYTIRQEGTMDGTNCRSPLGVGMSDGPAIRQTWESNRAVRLENMGETDI